MTWSHKDRFWIPGYNLRNIHNNTILGLVLTFAINLGLSSRVTRDALKEYI